MKLRPLASRAGFTLMEIMLVVAIIAILAGLLISKQAGLLDIGKETAAKGNMNTIKTSLLAYTIKAGNYPSTEQGLKALVVRPESEPRPLEWKKMLDEVPVDPWGYQFVYINPGIKKPDGFDLYSVGKDGKPNTEDDVWP